VKKVCASSRYGTGRHFFNPFLYERQLRPQVVVGAGELGVVINKFGKELPSGRIPRRQG
jgi:hypothetical protein